MIKSLFKSLRSTLMPAVAAGVMAFGAVGSAQASLAAAVPSGPFNALVFGDYRSWNADTYGGLIVGGKVNLDTYGVNSQSASTFGLWTGGGGTLNNGHVWGHMTSNVNLTMAGITGGQVFDAGDASRLAHMQRYYTGLSTTLAGDATARLAVRDPYSGLVFNADRAATRHVFNVNASDLPAVRVLDIRNIDPGEELILNILGSYADFSNLDLSYSLGAYRTLLNYVDATLVNFRYTAPWADVLAPLATIIGESGHIEGTVVAAGFDSQIELHMGRSDFWNVPGNAVPVPGSLPLTALALFALAWVRRQSRDQVKLPNNA